MGQLFYTDVLRHHGVGAALRVFRYGLKLLWLETARS